MSLNNKIHQIHNSLQKKFGWKYPSSLFYLSINWNFLDFYFFLAAVKFLYMYILTTIKFTYTQKYLYEVAIRFVFQYSKNQPHSQGSSYEYSQDFQGYNCWIRYTPSFISQGIFFPYIKTNINYWYLNNITYICSTIYLFILKKKKLHLKFGFWNPCYQRVKLNFFLV